MALILLFSFGACDVINPAEDIPAYLHVEAFDFEVSPAQGTGNQKITEGWVYVNGDFLGAYSLPATLPVLATGDTDVFIDPGIQDNGISATPDIYTFLKRYSTTITFEPQREDTIRPVTGYASNANFVFIEGFESNQHFFKEDLDNNEASKIELTTSDVFEGNSSALIRLDRDNPLAEVGSIRVDEYSPFGGTAVYIEMNYKTDVPIALGWIGYDGFGIQQNVIIDRGVNSSGEWKKIYFNFSEVINEFRITDVASYQLIIQAAIPIENGDFALDEANVLLDNIKMIQFQQ